MPLLKRLFWVYFLLLILEGALRKWILPQLSAPLLIVRDPIALLIIWEAYRTRKWPKQWSTATGVLAMGLLSLGLVQLIAGDNPWFAALYGLRSYLLPFPVAFIMGANLDAEDLRKFGNCTLWLLLPLTALEVMQYISPSNSFWNAGASEGATQLGYSASHVRASATFSYVMGPMFYVPMAGAFVFYGLANPKFAKRWLLWAAAGALVLSIPLIGSRTVAYELGALLACVVVGAFFGVSEFINSIRLIAVLLIVFALISQLPIFSDATSTFFDRFSDANNNEGGSAGQSFLQRVVRPINDTIGDSFATNNLLGIGIGRGANAVTRLIAGQVEYSAGEEAVRRTINECGWPCGLAILLFRYFLAIMIAFASVRRAKQQPLSLLLVPLTFHVLALGGLDQPTTQGFMVIGVGFSLAALRSAPVQTQSTRSLAEVGSRQTHYLHER